MLEPCRNTSARARGVPAFFLPSGAGTNPAALYAGDLNGDREIDLVAVGDGTFTVWRGVGDGPYSNSGLR